MIAKLKELGLGEYEIKAYFILLKHGSLTGSTVAKKAEVPQGKVYHALHKLNTLGFVSITSIKPQLFHAIKPEIAINTSINQKIGDLTQLKKEFIEETKKIQKPIEEDAFAEKIQVLAGKKSRYSINDYLKIALLLSNIS